jgi:hypothetical protein
MSDTLTPYPDDYVPRFTKEEVLRRIAHLAGRALHFKQNVEDRYPTWKIAIDPIVLIDVAKSAMDDIWRYKVYHLRNHKKRSDSIKRAAYFTKWITRLRPFSIPRPLDEANFAAEFDQEHDYTLMLNESFAIIFALNTMATESDQRKITLQPETMGSLLYDLHYRHLNDDALMSIFTMIRERARGRDIILT